MKRVSYPRSGTRLGSPLFRKAEVFAVKETLHRGNTHPLPVGQKKKQKPSKKKGLFFPHGENHFPL